MSIYSEVDTILDDDGLLRSSDLCKSFVTMDFTTKESQVNALQFKDGYRDHSHIRFPKVEYKADKIYPSWMLDAENWNTTKAKGHNEISDILEKNKSDRTEKEWSTLVEWIMSVWKIAYELGPKRCMAMVKAFHFFHYEPGTDIIVEGERGLTFYIIIDGMTEIIKNGVGVVAHLGMGKSFGEIALTQGNDLRTATVRAVSKVQTLSLHKSDYDMFVRDIQLNERRENFYLFRRCPLFKKWSREKAEKMANTAIRKIFHKGEEIFHQGQEADYVYIAVDGTVEVFKEVLIISRNRWPSTMTSWETKTRRTLKEIKVDTINKDGYFGEMAILKRTKRHATARAATECTLLCLGKLEFIHLLQNPSKSNNKEEIPLKHGQSDVEILRAFEHITGGPTSTVSTMETSIDNRKLNRMVKKERDAKLEVEFAGKDGKPSSPKSSHGHGTATSTIPESESPTGMIGDMMSTFDTTSSHTGLDQRSVETSFTGITDDSFHTMFLDQIKSQLINEGLISERDHVLDANISTVDIEQMEAEALRAERETESRRMRLKSKAVDNLATTTHAAVIGLSAVRKLKKLAEIRRKDRNLIRVNDSNDVSSITKNKKSNINVNVNVNIRETRQSLEHIKEIHDDSAHNIAKLWLVPKALTDVKNKFKSLAKGKKHHEVEVSKFESHARDQQFHMQKVLDRKNNSSGGISRYNLPSSKTKSSSQSKLKAKSQHSWDDLHDEISPSKVALSISKHHFSDDTNLALDEYKKKRKEEAKIGPKSKRMGINSRGSRSGDKTVKQKSINGNDLIALADLPSNNNEDRRERDNDEIDVEILETATVNSLLTTDNDDMEENDIDIDDSNDNDTHTYSSHSVLSKEMEAELKAEGRIEEVLDDDDILEEEEIHNLSAEQLAAMYQGMSYGKSKHEEMLENLDFDQHMDEIGSDQIDTYDTEKLKLKRHNTLEKFRDAGQVDHDDESSDSDNITKLKSSIEIEDEHHLEESMARWRAERISTIDKNATERLRNSKAKRREAKAKSQAILNKRKLTYKDVLES